MKGDDKEQIKMKTYFILYGILWFFGLMLAGAMGYQKHHGGSGTIFEAMDAVSHFKVFYWLSPSSWGTCLKWTCIYWIGVAMFLIYEQKWKHDAAGKEAGSAHWNDKVEEFNETHNEPFGEKTFYTKSGEAKENLNNPGREGVKPVPGDPNMIESELVRLSTADMKTHLNNNVFIVGGAGTGKSRFFIKPNVLQMNCSYIVTDPSGELLKSMHNVLVDNGYKIKVFNLVDMTHSNKYNPFQYVKTETDVSILVDCFISNTTAPDQKGGDPFWEKSEKALLTALIFYLVDIADEEFKKFSTILWMVQLAQMDENASFNRNRPVNDDPNKKPHFDFSLDTPLDELFNGNKKIIKKTVTDKYGKKQTVLDIADVTDSKEVEKLQDRIEVSLCLTNYKTFKLGGTKTLKSILISAAVRLNPFSIPAIQNLTDDDNVELEKVGDELTCFFAIIPQTNSTFNFLISMLFSQMFESLYREGAKIPNSRLNYHVRFLLDEFANIGKIPEFPQKISTCRKYNISTTIVLQSIAQIKMLYKDDYETIIGNCDTAICLGTNEQTTADYFSKKLGKSTITSRSKSTQIGKSGGNLSFQQTGRELMMPDEIMTMPFDECIVMMNHIAPFYDKKYPLEKHPQFQHTGDAAKENFYFLEKDEDFLCIGNAEQYEDEAVEENINTSGNVDDKYQPKPLAEVLKDVLVNIPEEDGYFLIKDTDGKETRKSLFEKERKKIDRAVEKCITNGYETVYYDGGSMEPTLLRGFVSRIMTRFGDEINDAAIFCDAINGSGHIGFVGTKDDECNIVKTTEKLRLKLVNKKTSSEPKFDTYKIQDVMTEEKYEKIKNSCEKGYKVIVSMNNNSDVEDVFNDYDSDF